MVTSTIKRKEENRMKATFTIKFDFQEMTAEEIVNKISKIIYPMECLDAMLENKLEVDTPQEGEKK